MNNLATTARPSTGTLQPSGMTREDDTRLRALLSRLERSPDGRWQLPDTRALTTDDRRWLSDRRDTLQRSLARCSDRVVAGMVLTMFLRFPSSANAADQAERDKLYVAELRQFPQWALEGAFAKVRGAFAPSLPDLVALVQEQMAAVHTEQANINRLLNADVYHVPSDEERARVEAEYQELAKVMRLGNDDMRPRGERHLTRAEAEQIVDGMKASPLVLPPMSDELKAIVGIPTQARA